MSELELFKVQSKLARQIAALKEERDLKVKLYERYIEGLKLLYDEEIEYKEKIYNALCHKNS